MDRSNKKNKKILHECKTANTSAIWQHAAHTTNQLLLAAKQDPYNKAYLFTTNLGRLSKTKYIVERPNKTERKDRVRKRRRVVGRV